MSFDGWRSAGMGRDMGAYCEKHDQWHSDSEPCSECYDRYERAQKIKSERACKRIAAGSALGAALYDMGAAFGGRQW